MQTAMTQNRPMHSNRSWAALMLISVILISLTPIADAKGSNDRPRHHDRHSHHYHDDDAYEYRRYDHRRGYRQPHHAEWRVDRRERAHRYAARAVDQAREARSFGYYFDHPRWSTRYRNHFRWALRARPEQLRRETRQRERRLSQLRYEAHRYDRRRDHYYGRKYPRR